MGAACFHRDKESSERDGNVIRVNVSSFALQHKPPQRRKENYPRWPLTHLSPPNKWSTASRVLVFETKDPRRSELTVLRQRARWMGLWTELPCGYSCPAARQRSRRTSLTAVSPHLTVSCCMCPLPVCEFVSSIRGPWVLCLSGSGPISLLL